MVASIENQFVERRERISDKEGRNKETKVRQRRRSESEYCFAGPKQEFLSRFLYTVSGSLKTIIQPIKTNRSSKKF